MKRLLTPILFLLSVCLLYAQLNADREIKQDSVNGSEKITPSQDLNTPPSRTVTILNEGFEGAFPSGSWNVYGSPTWDDESAQHHSGSWAGWCAGSSMPPSGNQYANNMSAEMIYGPIDLTDASTATFSFWSKLSTEANYDFLRVRIYYYTNGSWDNWANVWMESGPNNNTWHQVTGNNAINTFVGYQIKISFYFQSDSSVNNYSGSWIDDIVVTKETSVSADSYEPDNTASDYTSISITTSSNYQNHTLHTSTDQDWFRFWGLAGMTYLLFSSGNIDNRIYLYEDNGTTLIASDDDSGTGDNFFLETTLTESAYYKMKINGYSGATGAYTFNYYYETPPADSYEPDNSSTQYTALSISTATQEQSHTLHTSTDQDWFRFSGSAGRTYTFYSTGSVDNRIYLYQDNGTTLVDSNDNSGTGSNFELEFTPSSTAYYKLKVNGYDGAMGAYTFYYYYETPQADDYEPDNSSTQYTTLSISTSNQDQSHTLHTSTDQDWFRFNGATGRTYTFYSTGDVDNRLFLYQDNGTTLIDSNDNSGTGNNFELEFTPTSTANYKLKIDGYNGSIGSYTFYYSYEVTSGTISVAVQNVPEGMATLPGDDGLVKLYDNANPWNYITETTTNSSGIATFSNRPFGSYNVEAYHTPDPATVFGTEFWGSKSISHNSSNTTAILQRDRPYCYDVKVFNNTTGTEITGQSVALGTALRFKVYVRNPNTVSYNVKARIVVDRGPSSPWDYDSTTNSPVLINGNNGTHIFEFTYTPSSSGAYYNAIAALTDVNNGNYSYTDGWAWSQSPIITVTGSITVTQPDGSSSWYVGTTHDVTWTYSGTTAPVNIDLYSSTGTFIQNIVSNTSNDGSHPWYLDNLNLVTGNYYVRVYNSDASDNSNNFPIIRPGVEVTSPTASSVWPAGSQQSITWDPANLNYTSIAIELWNGSTYAMTIASSVSSFALTYPWTLPPTLVPGNQYRIRIEALAYPNDLIYDFSPNFTISTGIDLAIHNSSISPTTVQRGSLVTIQYDLLNVGTAGCGQNLTKFYLSTNSTWDGSSNEVYLGTNTQPTAWAGSSVHVSQAVTIPTNSTLGLNYIFIWADAIGNFNEPNENNNFSSPLPLTVTDSAGIPVATVATDITYYSFTANWNAATGAVSYLLDVSTDIAFNDFILHNEATSLTYHGVFSLFQGSVYYYRVRAVNQAGLISGYSNVITVVTIFGAIPSVSLTVPYYEQFDTEWCFPTCISMLLRYHGLTTQAKPWIMAKEASLSPNQTISVTNFNSFMNLLNTTFYPGTWEYGQIETSFLAIKSTIINAVSNYHPILVGGNFLNGGHVILVIGISETGVILHDPSGYWFSTPKQYHSATWSELQNKFDWIAGLGLMNYAYTNSVPVSIPTPISFSTINSTFSVAKNQYSLGDGLECNQLGLSWDGDYTYGYKYIDESNNGVLNWYPNDVSALKKFTFDDLIHFPFMIYNNTYPWNPSISCHLEARIYRNNQPVLVKIGLDQQLLNRNNAYGLPNAETWGWGNYLTYGITFDAAELGVVGTYRMHVDLIDSSDQVMDTIEIWFSLASSEYADFSYATTSTTPLLVNAGQNVACSFTIANQGSQNDIFTLTSFPGGNFIHESDSVVPNYSYSSYFYIPTAGLPAGSNGTYQILVTSANDPMKEKLISISYTIIASNVNISGTIETYGNVPITGVTINFSNSGGTASTNSSGYYTKTVPYGWSGMATPSKYGYGFDPSSRSYTTVTSNQTGNDYTGYPLYGVISGYVRTSNNTAISDVTLAFSNGGGSVTTDTDGYYEQSVAYGWSGAVTPSKSGYTFSPTSKTYANVTASLEEENYTGTLSSRTISGTIETYGNVPITGVTINFSNSGGAATTNSSGYYSKSVSYGWSGTATPSKYGYGFDPTSRSYTNVTSNQTGRDYTGYPLYGVISGYVRTSNNAAISDVTLAFSNGGGSVTTDTDGYYEQSVAYGWSGVVTPSKLGYAFSPVTKPYTNVTASLEGQDYTGTPATVYISGNIRTLSGVAISGVTVTFSNSGGTTTSNSNGYYYIAVPYGWSGTATPNKAGYEFDPASRTYTNATSHQTGKDYTAYTLYGYVSGYVKTYQGTPIPDVTLTFSANGETAVTDSEGFYEMLVPYGGSGSLTPAKFGLGFSPASIQLTNITSGLEGCEFTGFNLFGYLSGYVRTTTGNPIEGVTITLSNNGGSWNTDSDGFYFVVLDYGWFGRVTPGLSGYNFEPAFKDYSGVCSDMQNENFFGSSAALMFPANVRIVRSGSVLTLQWNSVSGATGYRVQASNNPDSGWSTLGTTATTSWAINSSASRKFFRVTTLQTPVK